MSGTYPAAVPAHTGNIVSVVRLTTRTRFSLAKASRKCPSAVILELKFLPVRSERSFAIFQSLGDLA
jgi:hypothetical protein